MQYDELAQRYRGDRAKGYDANREASDSWQREHAAVESFLREIPAGGAVLDVPVGTGRFLQLYARYGLRATGIDISPDMLEECTSKAKALGLDADLRQGDIRAIDAPDKTFDCVVCIRFLNWIDFAGVRNAVRELSRVANQLILGVNCRDPACAKHRGLWQRMRGAKRQFKRRLRGSELHIHEKADLERLFAENGLVIADCIGTNPRPEGSDYLIYFLRGGPPT